MVDSISASLGVNDSDGLIGVAMLGGGVIGALVLPILSDKFRKRKLFLVLGLGGMLPGVAGLAFADLLISGGGAYALAVASSFILGFFRYECWPDRFSVRRRGQFSGSRIDFAGADASCRTGFRTAVCRRDEC